jgi:hypothetical protein
MNSISQKYKRCIHCRKPLPETQEFFMYLKRYNKLDNVCRACKNYELKKWKHKHKENIHNQMIKYKFGLTSAEYANMLNKQEGKCAICGQKQLKFKLSVDHCHTTGKVRGLLCRTCNVGLGAFREDIQIMKSAIKYLKQYQEL